ncbi:MAG: M48 family metalloprotease [Candidatus Gracilibacteria bacterium]
MDSFRLVSLLGVLSIIVLFIARVLTGDMGLAICALLIVIIDLCIYFFSPRIVLSMARAKPFPIHAAHEIAAALEDLSRQANIPTPDLYLTPDPQPNIFSVGRNTSHASIAVTRGLVEVLSLSEIRAVMAHEIGHIAHNEILIHSISATLAGLLTAVLPVQTLTSKHSEEGSTSHGNSLGALLLLIVAPIASYVIKFVSSDKVEYKADFYGATLTREPIILARALEKIHLAVQEEIPLMSPNPALGHLYIANPFHSKTLTTLFSTHPQMEERITRLKTMLV